MKIFIPIKEHSQRVPGKNFRDFAGNPLYLYCLERFSQFELFVDTDSDIIIDACSNLEHVTAYRRKEEHIGDSVPVCLLVARFVAEYCDPEEVAAQIHVTSPFLKPETLLAAEQIMVGAAYDSTVACNRIQSRLWREEPYGYCPVNHNPMRLEKTQDLPVIMEENSAFYMFESSVVMETGNRVGIDPYFMSVEWPENVDIDDESDMRTALSIRKLMEDKK